MILNSTSITALGGLLLSATALAGGKSPLPTPPAPSQENPLSFWDGRIVLGLENQSRFEYREDNFDFDSRQDAATDDSWLLSRTRVSLLIKPTPFFKLFIQGQDSREFGSDRPNIPGVLGAEGDDPADIFQAYVEIGDTKTSPWSLKIGRQMLDYGTSRLVGSLPWGNFARSFDAIKISYTTGDAWLDAFAASPVVVDRSGLNESDLDTVLYGLYGHVPWAGHVVEPYALYLRDADTDRDVFTIATHLKSRPAHPGQWDYEAELAYQFGEIADRDLSALAGFAQVGYSLPGSWTPRLAVEYSFATGDRQADDAEINTFQNLYPTNHLVYGYMDLFSWQNLHDLRFILSAKPLKCLTLSVDWHSFWLASTEDGWRRANARTVVRPLDGRAKSASNYAGSELDCLMSWKAADWLSVIVGYSHFFAGGYLHDTGGSSDADFVYLMTQLRF